LPPGGNPVRRLGGPRSQYIYIYIYIYTHILYSVGGTTTWLRDGLSGFRIAGAARNFILLQSVYTGSGVHQASSPGFPPGGKEKRQEREFDHSSPSSAEVKKERSYPCSPPSTYLHVVGRDNYNSLISQ
jgi:hypothetical protein